MKQRFGQLFLIIGLILLVIFFTDTSETPVAWFFFVGLMGVLLGGYLVWKGRALPGESGRFRTVRKIFTKKK